jgi:hypothetical protein
MRYRQMKAVITDCVSYGVTVPHRIGFWSAEENFKL